MNRAEALEKAKNEDVRVKLKWWSDYMFIWFDVECNCFRSGANEEIDLKFLQDGEFEIALSDDSLLGGLFDIQGDK